MFWWFLSHRLKLSRLLKLNHSHSHSLPQNFCFQILWSQKKGLKCGKTGRRPRMPSLRRMLRTDWHPLGVSVREGKGVGVYVKCSGTEAAGGRMAGKCIPWLWALERAIWNSVLNPRQEAGWTCYKQAGFVGCAQDQAFLYIRISGAETSGRR